MATDRVITEYNNNPFDLDFRIKMSTYCQFGQVDEEGFLNGFARTIDVMGKIVEGQFKDGYPHGFQRIFYDYQNQYHIKWYKLDI